MATSLDALRGLTSNVESADNPIQGYLNRQKRIAELKHNLEMSAGGRGSFTTGATPSDVEGLELSQEQDPYAGAAPRAAIARTQALNEEMGTYNRPDVTARREAEAATKLKLAGEPARVAGEANLASARAAGEAKLAALQELLGMGGDRRVNLSGVGSVGPDVTEQQRQRDMAASERVAATGRNRGLVERLKALQTGKASAQGPGGLAGFFGGNKAATEAEIASILAQLNGVTGVGSADESAAVPMIAPDGRELLVPADRVAEAEARGARRQ